MGVLALRVEGHQRICSQATVGVRGHDGVGWHGRGLRGRGQREGRKGCGYGDGDGNGYGDGNGDGNGDGDTLHDAFAALQREALRRLIRKERIAAFREKFPKYDAPYSNRDLFAYHHVLTGSCRMGREQFCQNHGISLDGSTTVRQFVLLTKGSYGGGTIAKLPQAYGVE